MSQTQVQRPFIADKTSLFAQAWVLTSEIANTSSASAAISANMSIYNADGYNSLGSVNMTFSSGVFTFPLTGIYKIQAQAYMTYNTAASNYNAIQIQTTLDNSTYSPASVVYAATINGGNYANMYCDFIFDVSDTTNRKCRFFFETQAGATLNGTSSAFLTGVTFTRLGDT